MTISITKTQTPKEKPSFDNLPFGRIFTDHMFVMEYEAGKGWTKPRLKPFGKFPVHPASTVLHYGAEVFEGAFAVLFVDVVHEAADGAGGAEVGVDGEQAHERGSGAGTDILCETGEWSGLCHAEILREGC